MANKKTKKGPASIGIFYSSDYLNPQPAESYINDPEQFKKGFPVPENLENVLKILFHPNEREFLDKWDSPSNKLKNTIIDMQKKGVDILSIKKALFNYISSKPDKKYLSLTNRITPGKIPAKFEDVLKIFSKYKFSNELTARFMQEALWKVTGDLAVKPCEENPKEHIMEFIEKWGALPVVKQGHPPRKRELTVFLTNMAHIFKSSKQSKRYCGRIINELNKSLSLGIPITTFREIIIPIWNSLE